MKVVGTTINMFVGYVAVDGWVAEFAVAEYAQYISIPCGDGMVFKEVMRCKHCGAPIHQIDYVGANIAKTKLYYFCPKCHRLAVEVRKDVEKET